MAHPRKWRHAFASWPGSCYCSWLCFRSWPPRLIWHPISARACRTTTTPRSLSSRANPGRACNRVPRTHIACGLLFALAGVGMARARIPGGGIWGARLVGVFAVGLIAAGVFTPDPALGFPRGASPAVAPEVQSWHSQLHGAAFDVAFLSAIMACFLFARGFASIGEAGWAAYAAITGLLTPILIVLGFANTSGMGLLFFAAGALTMSWLSEAATYFEYTLDMVLRSAAAAAW